MKTFKEWLSKHKSEILTSIITTIIIAIGTWIWNHIVQGLPSAGYSIITAYRNTLYTDAARTTSITATLSILAIVLGIMTGTIFCIVLFPLLKKILNKNMNQIESIEKKAQEIDNESDIDKQKEEMANLAKMINNAKAKQKRRKVFSIIISIILLFTMIIYSITSIYPLTLRSAFETSIAQIKPYISETEMDNLMSKWTLMTSKEDFDEINDYILNIRQSNNLIPTE